MSSSNKAAGAAGRAAESRARDFLQQRGLRIRALNYRAPRGEIDIVAEEGNTLVFVEVRMRRHTRFGTAADSIDAGKQRRLIKAAQYYLQVLGHGDSRPCRFDAICVTGNDDAADVLWVRDAFQLDS